METLLTVEEQVNIIEDLFAMRGMRPSTQGETKPAKKNRPTGARIKRFTFGFKLGQRVRVIGSWRVWTITWIGNRAGAIECYSAGTTRMFSAHELEAVKNTVELF